MTKWVMHALFRSAGCGLALAVLFACAPALRDRPEHQVRSLRYVTPGSVVIVGRIELHPALQPDEQVMVTDRDEELKNTFFLYVGDRIMDLNAAGPISVAGSFSIMLDKDFFIKLKRERTLYVSGGSFSTMPYAPSRAESHIFSSPFQIELRPNDEAVYIGTIQYFRDGSNKLTGMAIRDDYQSADSQYKARFGTSSTLRRALVMPVTSRN
jgi:hypothetical protein